MAIQTVKLLLAGVEYTGVPEGDKWAFNITAPPITSFNRPGGYYDLTLKATTTIGQIAVIDSEHPVFGPQLQLITIERIKPKITVTYPPEGTHVPEEIPRITFELRDELNGSGINIDTLAVTLNDEVVSDIEITPTLNGYDCSFATPALSLGIYVLTLGVKDNDGNTAIPAIHPFTHGLIFDRTQADIDYALALKQENESLPRTNLRISWDWRALNRIETFCKYLIEILTKYGYSFPATIKTNWNTRDLNSEVESTRVLNLVNTLRNIFVTSTTPETPKNPSNLTYQQANAIEKILHDLNLLIPKAVAEFKYSDEIYSGEDDWV